MLVGVASSPASGAPPGGALAQGSQVGRRPKVWEETAAAPVGRVGESLGAVGKCACRCLKPTVSPFYFGGVAPGGAPVPTYGASSPLPGAGGASRQPTAGDV